VVAPGATANKSVGRSTLETGTVENDRPAARDLAKPAACMRGTQDELASSGWRDCHRCLNLRVFIKE